jgi:hypothetical protein
MDDLTPEELITAIMGFESVHEVPYKRTTVIALKDMLERMLDVRQHKYVEVGDYVLVWHPNFQTSRYPDGMMFIYTKSSYNNSHRSPTPDLDIQDN